MKQKLIGYVDLKSKEFRQKFTASLYTKGILYRDTYTKKQAMCFCKADGSRLFKLVLIEVKK